MLLLTKTLMKITLERKILENDIEKNNNIIDKNVNNIWFLNIDKKSMQITLERKILENDIGKESNIIDSPCLHRMCFLKQYKTVKSAERFLFW